MKNNKCLLCKEKANQGCPFCKKCVVEQEIFIKIKAFRESQYFKGNRLLGIPKRKTYYSKYMSKYQQQDEKPQFEHSTSEYNVYGEKD